MPLPTPLLRRIVANPARYRGATLTTATAFLDLKRQIGQTVRPENIPPRGGCPTAEARAARLTIRITAATRQAPKRRPLICPGATVAEGEV